MIGAILTVALVAAMVLALIRVEIRTYQSRRELTQALAKLQRTGPRRSTATRSTPGSIPAAPMPPSHSGALG